jgi:riboflavin kinase/FMN adenylyltransferase
MPGDTAITIGNFDGVHVGHAGLIERARRLVGPAGRVVVLAFFPHPLTRLAPERAPAVLTPLAEKTRLVRTLGADDLRVLAPDDALLKSTPEEFVRTVAKEHEPAWIVEGDDFRFGARRAGSVDTLRRLASDYGYRLDVLETVEVELADQSLVRASSTIARWLITHGRMSDARRVLGRDYRLFGVVNPGAQRGRDLGFRTANLSCDNLAPGEGVYAGTAILPSGERRPAAISIGTNPTFERDGGAPISVEAHILDWTGAGAPDYGYRLALDIHEWVREQRVYSDPAPLVAQIARDVERVREICAAAETPAREGTIA